jgi:hypothetical protein
MSEVYDLQRSPKAKIVESEFGGGSNFNFNTPASFVRSFFRIVFRLYRFCATIIP